MRSRMLYLLSLVVKLCCKVRLCIQVNMKTTGGASSNITRTLTRHGHYPWHIPCAMYATFAKSNVLRPTFCFQLSVLIPWTRPIIMEQIQEIPAIRPFSHATMRPHPKIGKGVMWLVNNYSFPHVNMPGVLLQSADPESWGWSYDVMISRRARTSSETCAGTSHC